MDLNGSVKTPLGELSKKTLLVGGVIAGVVAVVFYRSYKANRAASAAATAGAAEINPATGYAYGSAEDAAALSAQGQYQFPTGSGGGGGGGNSAVNVGPVNNAQWTQSVISYWTDHDLGDPTLLSAALGVYLAGGVLTPAQLSLVQQAVAAEGYPPLAGNGGYPPHYNTTPAGNTPVPTTPTPTTPTFETGEFSISVAAGSLVDTCARESERRRGHPVDWQSIQNRNPSLAGDINWGPSGSKDPLIRKFTKNATYVIPRG